jgi:GT2 family glycosyltransferase
VTKPSIGIICPTWNNPEFLNPCIDSILRTGVIGPGGMAELIIVNNGRQPVKEYVSRFPPAQIKVIDTGKNLGWEGGLAEGLKHTEAPFLVFQNDDTFLPQTSQLFYHHLLWVFNDDNVGAVGPITTTAAGVQSTYRNNSPWVITQATYLIFFCVMVRRKHLEEIGGIDVSLPGGDDIDLCMRLRKAGRKVMITPNAFIIHHGFKTGNRIHGDGFAGIKNGWNSQEMTDRTNFNLIRKHGFKEFIMTLHGSYSNPFIDKGADIDLEGDLVRSYVPNHGASVVDLGCGYRKTVPDSTGVDRIASGETIPFVPAKGTSIADVNADVQEPLPFGEGSKDVVIARHILEHCLDSIKTVKQWGKILKIGGRMIISVPDEKVTKGIPLNAEHLHGFNNESLKTLMETCGFKEIESKSTGNGISFVGVYEKC